MRWSTVGLLVLGIVAAACTAVLMNIFRENMRSGASASSDVAERPVPVVVVTRDIEPMDVLDARSMIVRELPAAEAPKGCYASEVNLVGKVVSVSLREGQPILKSALLTRGTAPEVVSTLPKGMRAVSIPIGHQAGIENLLYPGCLVDVLASFRVVAESEGGPAPKEAISSVLMQGVRVLSVGDRTIVSPAEDEFSPTEALRRRPVGRALSASLVVTPPQAEALQLAMEHGTLSLAVRNPVDDGREEGKGTLLTDISEDLAALMKRATAKPDRFETPEPPEPKTPPAKPLDSAPPETAPADKEKPKWVTIILRGEKQQTQEFEIADANANL